MIEVIYKDRIWKLWPYDTNDRPLTAIIDNLCHLTKENINFELFNFEVILFYSLQSSTLGLIF